MMVTAVTFLDRKWPHLQRDTTCCCARTWAAATTTALDGP
jgi:hypothetical protein